jgi:hypothetical protein
MKPDFEDSRKYIEIVYAQKAKRAGRVCGDYILIDRTPEATTAILADGIGTGVKASVASVMCASRLMELLRLGFTLREACKKIVDTMHEARTSDIPFSAFSVCRILNNGHATIISYEIPSPILISRRFASYLPQQRFLSMGLEMIAEVNNMLDYDDGIILTSDGVSQAGMGRQYGMGWGVSGASYFINGLLAQGVSIRDVPEKILAKVKDISGKTYGDDTTCLLLLCREAKTLNVLTGPPSRKSADEKVVNKFMEADGTKIVCGSTTVDMVARVLKIPVKIRDISGSYHKPPSYELSGIDYATEGALTLNQVYNILDENPDQFESDSSVSDLCRFFNASDTINFTVGTATNRGHESIVFRQMGVFPREIIVKLIAEKLRKMGKLVSFEYV